MVPEAETTHEQTQIFISYAHDADSPDTSRRHVQFSIEQIHRGLEHQLKSLMGDVVHIFYDTEDIRDFDHWKTRCFRALDSAKILLVLITKAYLRSNACRWEWNHWSRLQLERGQSDLSSRLLFIPIEELDPSENKTLQDLQKNLGNQLIDGTPWLDSQGKLPVDKDDITPHLTSVAAHLVKRLEEIQQQENQRAQKEGNLGWPNARFVSRDEKEQSLLQALQITSSKKSPHIPCTFPEQDEMPLPILSGPGGFGKTALAHNFLHNQHNYFPGGIWHLRASSQSEFHHIYLHLVKELNVEFTDEEKADPSLQLQRLFEVHQQKGPSILFIDNLDQPQLVSSILAHLHPQRHWLRVLITSRLPEADLQEDIHRLDSAPPHQIHAISVKELTPLESLELFRQHQPNLSFENEEIETTIRSIAHTLGHHALSIESSAILLGQSDPRIAPHPRYSLTPAQHLNQLSQILDDPSGTTGNADRKQGDPIAHLAAIFQNTKKRLSPQSLTILQFAAVLPSEKLPLPWLRELASTIHPELSTNDQAASRPLKELKESYFNTQDSWLKAINPLLNSRLLTHTQDSRIVSIHRLHQSVFQLEYPVECSTTYPESDSKNLISEDLNLEQRQKILKQEIQEFDSIIDGFNPRQFSVYQLICNRNSFLESQHSWLNTAWEVYPLDALALCWAEQMHPEAAWLLSQVANYFFTLNEWASAERLVRRALSIDEARRGPNHPDFARDLNNLGQLLHATNRLDEAEQSMRLALAVDKANFGSDHPKVAIHLGNLAGLHQSKNQLEEAKSLILRALTINKATYGEEHPTVATNLTILGGLLQETNQLSEAETLIRRAISIGQVIHGADHPKIAIYLSNLAEIIRQTTSFAEAEELMSSALRIDEQAYGNDHPNVAIRLSNLACLLHDTNRSDEAEKLIRRALAIDKASFGEDHPRFATHLTNLAAMLETSDRLTEAEPFMRRAIQIFEDNYGKNHPKIATGFGNLAGLLIATGRLEEAEQLQWRALAIEEKSYGKTHPRVALRLSNLAELLRAEKRFPGAEPLIRRAIAIDEVSLEEDHPQTAIHLNNLAQLLKDTERLDEAEPLMRRALQIDLSHFGKDHSNVATGLNNLGQLLKATQRAREAEPLMRRALAIDEANLGKNHPSVATRLNNLSLILEDLGRRDEAEPLSRRNALILLRFTKDNGHEHPNLRTNVGNYLGILYDTDRPTGEKVARQMSLGREAGWDPEEWKIFSGRVI